MGRQPANNNFVSSSIVDIVDADHLSVIEATGIRAQVSFQHQLSAVVLYDVGVTGLTSKPCRVGKSVAHVERREFCFEGECRSSVTPDTVEFWSGQH